MINLFGEGEGLCMCRDCECKNFIHLEDNICQPCTAGHHRLNKSGTIKKRRKDSEVFINHPYDDD